MEHRHRFSRIKLVLKVKESYYQILQCPCSQIQLKHLVLRSDPAYLESYPQNYVELSEFENADPFVTRKVRLDIYRCKEDGFVGDARQMGIHLGTKHGLNLRWAVHKELVEKTGESVDREIRA